MKRLMATAAVVLIALGTAACGGTLLDNTDTGYNWTRDQVSKAWALLTNDEQFAACASIDQMGVDAAAESLMDYMDDERVDRTALVDALNYLCRAGGE